ncbi:MAG: hypothetical protein ABI134_16890 [Byssovorax sp.]
MNRFFAFLQINALALLCFMVAGNFWKDYLQHPHRELTRAELVETTGPVKTLQGLASLPSGTSAGYWLLLRDPSRSFNLPNGIDYRDLQDRLTEGSEVTVAYSPEVDLTNEDAMAFSFRFKGKDYLEPDDRIASYNRSLADKRKVATLTTLAGFAALGLVWVLRKVVFPKVFGYK